MTKDTPPLQLDAATEAELDKILTELDDLYRYIYGLSTRNPAPLSGPGDAKAAITRLLIRERLEELKAIQQYWLELSMVVPRLQASPPPVKTHIADRVASLQAQLEKEGQGAR